MKKTEIVALAIAATGTRSAWNRGVCQYIREIAENLPDECENETREEFVKLLLCGADNWARYSDGGCSLIYDNDIMERLCNPSELKRELARKRSGRNWIRIQAGALAQAAGALQRAFIAG